MPVMRLQVDTDQDKVQPYERQKPMTELPVDANNVAPSSSSESSSPNGSKAFGERGLSAKSSK